jgi:hypothetical protein
MDSKKYRLDRWSSEEKNPKPMIDTIDQKRKICNNGLVLLFRIVTVEAAYRR